MDPRKITDTKQRGGGDMCECHCGTISEWCCYDPWSDCNSPAPSDTTSFDGGAIKKNWIPLVVLGLSLVVGIGLSEWATKKYIK